MTSLSADRRTMLALLASAALPLPAMAQAVPAGPVTIDFYGIASGGWQPVIDDFQRQYPNITVKWSKFGVDDLKQALKVAASSRRMPTMWYNWGGTLQSGYDHAGVVLETTDLLKQAKLTDAINPVALSLAQDDGKLYGMPYRLIPMSIIYRRDVFAAAGFGIPTTWDDFERGMATLQAKGVTPFATGGKFGWMTMRYVDLLLEHFAGPGLHDRLKALDASWDDPAVVAAYAKLKEWTDKGYFNRGFLGVDPTTAPPMLYDGKAAMILDNPGIESGRLIRDNVDLTQWGTFAVPTGHAPNRVSGYVTQLQISAGATPAQRDAAVLFLAHLAGPANAARYLATLGGPSAMKGVPMPDTLPIAKWWVQQLDAGIQMFLPSDQALPQELVNTYFETNDSVVLGALAPKDAARQMADAIKQYKAQR